MVFFRSEDMLNEWLVSNQVQQGAVLSIPKLWELSKLWYEGRQLPEYRGRTAEQVQQIFKEVGLTSEFWQAT